MYIDFHCDTISKIYRSTKRVNLFQNEFHVDLQKLQKGGASAQFFALFIHQGKIQEEESMLEYCLSMLDRLCLEVEENTEHIDIARSFEELKKNQNKNKVSAFISIEEGGVIGTDLGQLRNLYRLGVRLITLTWNFPNTIGFPNIIKEYQNKGLTEFGVDVVREMNTLGMLVDVSHLSDAGFYDVAKYSKQPFVASHSNARAVKDHPRNLTDKMIRMIADKGGIIGLNFYSEFLGDRNRSSIDQIVAHMKHIRNVGGNEVLAIGSDYDGIDCELEIENCGNIEMLFHRLKKEGFNEEEIDQIRYKNGMRVIKDILK